MQNILTRISLKALTLRLILLTLLLGCCVTGIAQNVTESALASTPLPLDKMNSIRFDTNLSDQQKVLALIHILDQRITQAPISDPTGDKPAPAHEYSYIIGYIAAHNDDAKDPLNGRIHAIETVISQLNTLQDITHKDEVRTYLYIALASAGGHAPEDVLLSLLNKPDTPTEILNAVLKAMQNSTVPIRALPRLLELTKNSFHYVFLLDVGPPNPRRIYPIREAALTDLTQLGIQAKAVSIEDDKVDPDWKARLSTTVIGVDRKSLITKLREWLCSDDPKIWRPAAEVAGKIPGEDVQEMLSPLLNRSNFPPEKVKMVKDALVWEPMPLDKINSIKYDTSQSDLQKVLALTHVLDQRISLASVPNPTGYKPAPTREYVYIIGYISARDLRAKDLDTDRIQAIQTVIQQLDTSPDIVNKTEVRTYLYIALASAGGNAPEDVLLSLLNNPDSPTDILNAVLTAMQYSTVPIHSLPRLLELTEHPYNYVFLNDLGTPNPRRIYPIREAALADLTQLGIQAKAVSIEDEKVDPGWKARLSTTVIEVDRKSLVTKLREWLNSDDPKIWRPAAEVIGKIPGEDVSATLADFLKESKLSPEKKRALTQK